MTACSSTASPTFQPALRIISAITKANPAAVTTTIDHDYITGEIIRLRVPNNFGMRQAEGLKGEITVTGTDTFTINIDSSSFDTFAAPSPLPSAYTCAQTIPMGEINSILSAATKNVLPTGVR